jgi:hypothetical protein
MDPGTSPRAKTARHAAPSTRSQQVASTRYPQEVPSSPAANGSGLPAGACWFHASDQARDALANTLNSQCPAWSIPVMPCMSIGMVSAELGAVFSILTSTLTGPALASVIVSGTVAPASSAFFKPKSMM